MATVVSLGLEHVMTYHEVMSSCCSKGSHWNVTVVHVLLMFLKFFGVAFSTVIQYNTNPHICK